MRVEKTIKNIKVAMIYQITILLFTFIDKKIFLTTLGIEHAGLHGLFTNMISMLSLAELGVGIAIIYNLYKPLEEEKQEEISALMRFYKATYYKIGIAIGIIGSILALFLPLLINEPVYDMGYIRGIYFIFLIGTVFTYFTGYKRSLLYADQKNYLLLIGDMTANTMGVFLKLWILLVAKNYPAYVLVHVLFKVAPNIWASYQVDRLYPYIKQFNTKLSREKLEQIKANVKDLFIHKMSNFVMMATDNLIISSFIGLNAVGLVASYNMIAAALMGFIGQAIEGIQASMGNLVASESKERVKDVFDKITFASFWIASFCAVSLVCLVQPFIQLWLGKDFLLPNHLVALIILNLFLWIITRPLWQMMTVTGLFKEEKINSVVEIVVKLGVSILLVQRIGMAGVFIGTTITYFVAWIMKSYFLYRKFFKRSFLEAYVKLGVYLLVAGGQVVFAYGISRAIPVANDYLRFMVQMMVCLIVPNLINYALFFRTKNFTYFKSLIGDILMKIRDQLGEEKNQLKIQKILFVTVAVLIFLLPLERTLEPKWHIVGKLAAVGIFGLTNLYIVNLLLVANTISEKAKRIIWIYAAAAIGLTAISLFRGGIPGAKAAIMMVLMLNVGLAMAYVDYGKMGKWIYVLEFGVLAYIVTMVSHYTMLEKKPKAYLFIFNNPNYLGLICVLLIFICLVAYGLTKGKRYFIYLSILAWISNLTQSRTAILALLVTGVVYLVWKIIIKHKWLYYTFFAGVMGGIITVTMFYPVANTLPSFNEINERIVEKTGKDIFTGRQEQWTQSVDLIKEKPMSGYGMEATLENLTESELSTHNIYLQLLLQGGLLLLSLCIGLVTWLWKRLHNVADSKITQVGASVLVGILVIGIFELTLLGQSISFGILQWFTIGLGSSLALRVNNDTQYLEELN